MSNIIKNNYGIDIENKKIKVKQKSAPKTIKSVLNILNERSCLNISF